MARKAIRGAIAVNALGQLGSGFMEGLKQRMSLEDLAAQRALEKHKVYSEEADRANKAQLDLAKQKLGTTVQDVNGNQSYVPGLDSGYHYGTDANGLQTLIPPTNPAQPGSKAVHFAPSQPRYLNQVVDESGAVVHQDLLPPGVKPGTTTKPQPPKTGPSPAAKSQLATLDQLETLLKGVKTGIPGVTQRVGSVITGGAYQSPAKVYNDLRDAVAVGLYRTATGDTRISDSDVGRARSILPDPYDSPDTRQAKLDFVRSAIKAQTANATNSPHAQISDDELLNALRGGQ